MTSQWCPWCGLILEHSDGRVYEDPDLAYTVHIVLQCPQVDPSRKHDKKLVGMDLGRAMAKHDAPS